MDATRLASEPGRGGRPRRRPGLGAICLAFAVAAGCSAGSPPSATQPAFSLAPPLTPAALPSAAVTPLPSAADTGALKRQGFPSECPSVSESLEVLNRATYMVFAEQVFRDAEGQATLAHVHLGTAWAAGERLLVTNAHVAESFPAAAARGVQLSRAIAVQSGTGTVVRLTRTYLHPQYAGITTPDVAVFESERPLPVTLPLAPPDSVLGLGDEIQIVGFPLDVDRFLTVVPGETVPQATALTGSVTAHRAFDQTHLVTPETLSIYQHQAPTTVGTSGSSMFHCGLVAGVNNAGTERVVIVPDATGESFLVDRIPAAANNFGIHVRYVHEVVDAFRAGAAGAFEIPVAAAPVSGTPLPSSQPPASDPPVSPGTQAAVSIIDFGFQPTELAISAGETVTWTNTGQVQHTVTSNEVEFDSGPIDPGSGTNATFPTPGVFSYFCAIHPQMRGTVTVQPAGQQPSVGAPSLVGRYVAGVDEAQATHGFAFVLDETGMIQGTSTWPNTAEFALAGMVNADGTFQMTDDAPERRGFRRGIYQGVIAADGTISGVYFEQTREQTTFAFSGRREQ